MPRSQIGRHGLGFGTPVAVLTRPSFARRPVPSHTRHAMRADLMMAIGGWSAAQKQLMPWPRQRGHFPSGDTDRSPIMRPTPTWLSPLQGENAARPVLDGTLSFVRHGGLGTNRAESLISRRNLPRAEIEPMSAGRPHRSLCNQGVGSHEWPIFDSRNPLSSTNTQQMAQVGPIFSCHFPSPHRRRESSLSL